MPRRAIVGLVIAAAGLLVLLLPFVSVWRVSAEVLDQLPEVPTETSDDRHRFALSDSDFVLAERTYHQYTGEEVEAALLADGFERIDSIWLSKQCCGDYDAVWANVGQARNGDGLAILTVADNDIQSTWVIFAVAGAGLALAGSALALSGSGRAARIRDWGRSGPPIPYTDRSDDVVLQREKHRGMRGG